MTEKERDTEEPIAFVAEDDRDDEDRAGKSAWDKFMEALSAGVRLSVIVGVVFTAVQYYASLGREQTQRSFELVDLWESDRMQSAQAVLKNKLETLQMEAQTVLGEEGASGNVAFVQKLIASRLLEDARDDKELGGAYSSVVYFLNRVSNCATSGLCNESVLKDFFRDYAQQFWDYFGESLSAEIRQDSHPIKKYLDDSAS